MSVKTEGLLLHVVGMKLEGSEAFVLKEREGQVTLQTDWKQIWGG
jgi:hypothetical protein